MTPEEERARRVLKKVGETAREKAFAAGQPVVYLKDGVLVREWSDGRIETVAKYCPCEECFKCCCYEPGCVNAEDGLCDCKRNRMKALEELTKEAQEQGFYDDPKPE